MTNTTLHNESPIFAPRALAFRKASSFISEYCRRYTLDYGWLKPGDQVLAVYRPRSAEYDAESAFGFITRKDGRVGVLTAFYSLWEGQWCQFTYQIVSAENAKTLRDSLAKNGIPVVITV